MTGRPKPIRLIPRTAIRWGGVILVIVVLGLSTVAMYQGLQRDDKICNYAKQNRLAALADVRDQSQILVDFAIAQAERDGDEARAERVRDVVGPPFVKAQVDAAQKRRPPINCSDL